MRRITILCMALAMSAFAFSSCAYQDWVPEPSKGGSDSGNDSGLVIPAVTDFSVYASLAQTTSLVTEEGALAWTAGDLINVFHGIAGEAELISDGVVFYNPKSEKPNEFLGKLGKELKKGYTYDWYIFYPYTEDLSIVENKGAAIIGSKADTAQIQNGYGDKAHISGDYMPMFGVDTGVEEGKTILNQIGSSVNINFDKTFGEKKNIRYRATFYTFYDYRTPPTVRWDNTLDYDLTKYLSLQLYGVAYYHKPSSNKMQYQYSATIGLAYKFKNK